MLFPAEAKRETVEPELSINMPLVKSMRSEKTTAGHRLNPCVITSTAIGVERRT